MTEVQLVNLQKMFGETRAVAGVDLRIAAGELFFLLGPSGCGKTTLLRMIAGFIEPTAGNIRFGGKDVTHLPPEKRNTGMVFQGYALWPHMTVMQNVMFGLDVRKCDRREKKTRVERALSQVKLAEYAHRKPNALSGGQQQRVALARALVIEPTVLLLDEPLSNLDAKLRNELRVQVRDICKNAGITAIYVTHDQKEALSMADRMAVIDRGKVVQSGPPREVYERPTRRFVADFLGETNLIAGRIANKATDHVMIETAAGTFRANVFPHSVPVQGNVTCSIRPETLRLVRNGDVHADIIHANEFMARHDRTVYLGEMAQHRFVLDDGTAVHSYELNSRPVNSEEVKLRFDADDAVILQD